MRRMVGDGKPIVKVEPATLVKPVNPNIPEAAGITPNESFSKFQQRDANLGRRRVPRRTFDSPVGVLMQGTYDLERSFQVGEGGMMISSRRKMEAGQTVVISFYLPTSATIVVRGVIRSVIPADKGLPERYGLEFVNLGFQFKREIRNFVASATGFEAA